MSGRRRHRPAFPYLAVVVFVFGHWLCYDRVSFFPDTEAAMRGDAGLTIYVGAAALAGILAGFGGVVMTFLLGSSSARFVVFRHDAGPSLTANWIAASGVSFLAAFGFLTSATLWAVAEYPWAWWVFETFVLLLAVSTWRILRVLRQLVALVGEDDAQRAPEAADSLKIGLDEL